MSSPLQDRVFIVTGGSKGFGLAIAQSLVAQGGRVGLLGRNKGSLDAAVSTLGADNAIGVAAAAAPCSYFRTAAAAAPTAAAALGHALQTERKDSWLDRHLASQVTHITLRRLPCPSSPLTPPTSSAS